MRKITFLCVILLFSGLQMAFAQQKTVSGTVTSKDDGTTLPGVTVVVKGTTIGTVTDANGKFTLSVPAKYDVLVVSFVGMKPQEVVIGTKITFDVILETDVMNIEGVVVTALGISREKKSLGYSSQEINGKDLSQVQNTNVINSISGRVSGIQVTGSSGNMGGSSRILVRGVSSISGNNQPLFVVDGIPIDNSDYNTTNASRGAGGYDYGNMAQDINSDDIESVLVLKGANASALYGSRAANGVILITTKKGKLAVGEKGRTFGVSVNSGISFDRISIQPKRQNEYGGGAIISDADGGSKGFEVANIGGTDYLVPQYGTDESFGPKYDENIKVLPWNAFDAWDTEHYMKPVSWVAPKNDVDYFFKTGINVTNNVAITGGNENSAFRLSYTNLYSNGYMPNSKLYRNTINISANTTLKNKINAFINANYVQNKATGRPETGYGNNNVTERMNQWGQRQVDYKDLEAYKNPDGTQRSWNRTSWDDATPAFSDNPYWSVYKNYENDQRDRFFGNVGVSYTILPWLKATGKVNLDYYSFRIQERVAVGSQATSSYSEGLRTFSELNYEFLIQADKNIAKDLHILATFGGNRMNRNYFRNISTTADGLLVPDLYTLSNSTSPYLSDDYSSKKRINSLFGSVSLDYLKMIYLDFTLRNDWSSTLPIDKCSYLYPSVTASWVFTELKGLQKASKVLSFGKIRLGWAKVGNDTDPYRLSLLYANAVDANGSPYNFGQLPLYSVPGQLNNTALKPEITSSIEAGADIKFFNNRLGVDFTYYVKTSKNQILPVSISATSGYTSMVVNAGEIKNTGYEVMLTGTPFKMKNNGFKWNIFVNFAKNKNKVIDLYPGVDTYLLANAPFLVSVNAKVGEEYGAIMGTDFVYDNNGNKVVDQDGYYLVSAVKSIGNVMPDWNAGITNEFSFKGISLSCLIDIQHGGDFFSTTNLWGMYTGILEKSVGNNDKGNPIRDDVANGGGVKNEGVYGQLNTDGSITYIDASGNPSASAVTNTTYIDGHSWCWGFYDGPAKQNVFDASYVKLREVRLGYEIPSKATGPIKNITIAVWGRNLATWGTANKDLDPETPTSSGNIQGLEGSQMPSLRTYGLNLSFNF